MTSHMYDLTDPTTRATVQEIRRQAIQDAAASAVRHLQRAGLLSPSDRIAIVHAIMDTR